VFLGDKLQIIRETRTFNPLNVSVAVNCTAIGKKADGLEAETTNSIEPLSKYDIELSVMLNNRLMTSQSIYIVLLSYSPTIRMIN